MENSNQELMNINTNLSTEVIFILIARILVHTLMTWIVQHKIESIVSSIWIDQFIFPYCPSEIH